MFKIITSVVDWETARHTCVTCQAESSAETFLQFQRDVENLRRECQPRKGRSLAKSGRWTFSFPAVDVPSIEVKIGEAMGRGPGSICSRVTYRVHGEKTTKQSLIQLFA